LAQRRADARIATSHNLDVVAAEPVQHATGAHHLRACVVREVVFLRDRRTDFLVRQPILVDGSVHVDLEIGFGWLRQCHALKRDCLHVVKSHSAPPACCLTTLAAALSIALRRRHFMKPSTSSAISLPSTSTSLAMSSKSATSPCSKLPAIPAPAIAVATKNTKFAAMTSATESLKSP